MIARNLLFSIFILLSFLSCSREKPVETKPAPLVVVKPKPQLLTPEERLSLKISPEIIDMVETAVGGKSEPFFATVVIQTENLKGTEEVETRKLAGFSVRTAKSDEIIDSLRPALKKKGCLIFKSQKGYGSLPDIVTVVRGNNSYDMLKIQRTASTNSHPDTKTIISWLKAHQKEASFFIIGAGPDWVEARFIKPPKNMQAFAQEVAEFSPEVLARDTRTVEKLAKAIEKMNGFTLGWD